MRTNPALAMATLCLTLLALGPVACSGPVNPRKPVSRKSARQMEHYNNVYGGTPVLGEPSRDSQYVPRQQEQNGFNTFQIH